MYDNRSVDQETREFLERFAAQSDANLKAAVEDLKLYVREQIEASETKIITAFWSWSRPFEARMRRLDAGDAATAERLTGLEERISTIERRIGLGHAGPAH